MVAPPPRLHVAVDEGSGAPVVMLHGIASSWVTFQNVIPRLDGHRVVALDLLGFGASPAPPDGRYRIDDHVAAITRTLLTLGVGRDAVLVGHSMGSLIAARLAARHPTRFRRLVLVSPPIYLSPAELADPRDRVVMTGYLKAYEFLRENEDFTLARARFVQRLLPIKGAMDINAENWVPFVRSLKNTIETQTTLSDLAAIRAPVDIVYGSLDEFRSDGALRIVARLRGVEVHRVLGSDHLIGKRLAAEVVRLIES